jgi:hypothetical protein
MGNIYSRELFNDEKGVIDWRFIALSALMNQPFEGITAKERETIEAAITRIRNLDERLERRDGSA